MQSSDRLRPGQVAPRSGVYRVHHYAHRMPHAVIVLEGDLLPECSVCGDRVRFVPMMAAEPIANDANFSQFFEKRAAS